MTVSLVSSEIERWLPAARALASGESAYAVPLEVLFGEAIDVVRFVEKYWSAVRDGSEVVRPGLELAVGKRGSLLTPKIGEEILSLHDAARDAHTMYLLELDKVPESPMPRALETLRELRDGLTYLLDDDVDDVEDARLAKLVTTHWGALGTMDEVAMALDNFAGFAELHRAALDGLGDFSATTIDDARALSKELRMRPSVPVTQTEAAREALDLRDRLVKLLYDRMSAVRAAARFVFRKHPVIVREVTSAYERRRRAEKRRADVAKRAAETTSD